MNSLIKYFIRYPASGNILMLVIFILGFMGYNSLKKNFFPQFDDDTIIVQLTYPGASPEEIEEGVVLKIEDNLEGITGLDRVSSVSKENTATITIEALQDYDIDEILQDVKNAVDQISSFPANLEPPVIFIQENLNFSISFAVSGNVDLKLLKEYSENIEDDLLEEDFISKVSLSGFPPEEIEIALDENKLRKYNTSVGEVADAVRANNIEVTGGTIKGDKEELLIRGKSKQYYGKELYDLVVKANENGQIVYLSDVSILKDRWKDNPERNYLNNEPSVTVTVNNTVNEDILKIVDHVKNYIEEYNKEHQEVRLTVIRDGSVSLKQRIGVLENNAIIGFLLVLFFLALFLNLKLSFWVAISIPISFLGMFMLAVPYGLTINVISLFGMILVIGILVDDGIVIGENIFQHYERGKSPIKAAIDGTFEVLPAVSAAVLTTIVAFSMFYFLEGRIGEFITDMAFVVIATLIFSLVEGALILPGHIAHSLPERDPSKYSFVDRLSAKIEVRMKRVLRFLREQTYAPLLRFCVRHQVFALLIVLSISFLTIAGFKAGIIKTTFFPSIERDNIDVTLELKPGTRETITEDILRDIQHAAWRVNEYYSSKRDDNLDVIENIEMKIGPQSNQGSLNIILLDTETRNLRSYDIANKISEEMGPIPEAEKLAYGIRGIFGKPVSVSLKSNNLSQLQSAKEELKDSLKNLSVLKDVIDNDQKGIKEIHITLKDKAYHLGLDTRTIISQIRNAFFGEEVQRLQRGLDEIRVWVRFSEEKRNSISNLDDLRIRVQDKEYPVKELVNYEIRQGIVSINHLNGKREIRVEADLADPNASATDVQEKLKEDILPPILSKYPSISVTYEGQSRESAKTGRSAQKVIPVILLVMAFIVSLVFRSIFQTVVVFLCLPFGLIGVAWGHYIVGLPISILSAYGIIALLGIMINDSIVLVTATNDLIKEGYTFKKALISASISRFRPIILTSITTIAGLGPLILDESFQAQFLRPMAVSVAFGMIVATAVTLVLLPVLLNILNIIRVYFNYLWTGKKPDEAEVEPAFKEMMNEHEDYNS